MITPEEARSLVDLLAPLGKLLYPAFEGGHVASQEHHAEYRMLERFYRKNQTDLARAHTCRRIVEMITEEPELAAGWSFDRQAWGGAIRFSHEAMLLRMLRSMPDGMAPPPGPNEARINYYRNDRATLFGVQASNLIRVWEVDPENGEALIRIVRTTGTWRFLKAERTDFDWVLPRPDSVFLGGEHLEFLPDPGGIELPLRYDEDEEQPGGFVDG